MQNIDLYNYNGEIQDKLQDMGRPNLVKIRQKQASQAILIGLVPPTFFLVVFLLFAHCLVHMVCQVQKRSHWPTRVRTVQDHFIFTVESTGALHPEDIVRQSIQVITQKLHTLSSSLEEPDPVTGLPMDMNMG